MSLMVCIQQMQTFHLQSHKHGLFLLAMILAPRLQEAPQGLQEVLKQTDATGKMRIIQQMSINIIPIVEKGLLDPVITHGWVHCKQSLLPLTLSAEQYLYRYAD